MGEPLKGKLRGILGQTLWLRMHLSLSRLGRWGHFSLSHLPASPRYKRGSWLMGMTG